MGEEEPQTFADRLPPVVPREEADISHLSDEMADLLYPGRRGRPFRMGLVFETPEGPGGARALELARGADAYAEEPPMPTAAGDRPPTPSAAGDRPPMPSAAGHWPGRRGPRHRAEFGTGSASRLRDLFALVGGQAGTEVLVDGKRVPYARELWLPLFWILVRD